MKIVVSACLLGENCKYNGGNNQSQKVLEFVKTQDVIPVCPEMQAGMGCPRIPIEIKDGTLIDKNGRNWDGPMHRAISEIMEKLKDEEIRCAILKARSPTCGVHAVYDGTFSGNLVPGAGVFAQALMDADYTVLDDEEL